MAAVEGLAGKMYRCGGDAQWAHGGALYCALEVVELVMHRKLLIAPLASQPGAVQGPCQQVQTDGDVAQQAPAQL